jgi:hypothetical protein
MNSSQFKPLDITQAKHIGVTVPLAWLGGIFVLGLTFHTWIFDVFGLITSNVYAGDQSKLSERVEKIEATLVQVQRTTAATNTKLDFSTALGYLRGLQNDLKNHRANPENTPAWRLTEQTMEGNVMLAQQYTTCIRKKEPSCDLLLEQLMPALLRNSGP